MPPRFEFEFSYEDSPGIVVVLRLPAIGSSIPTFALIDTGAEMSLFDVKVAEALGVDLQQARQFSVIGIGGTQGASMINGIELALLGEPDLTVTLNLAFAETAGLAIGNLIGLDVLEHFDFGLSHRERVGYLGRAP